MKETDSDSVPKFVFITSFKKAEKQKIGVSFILYNNIVIKLHRNVPCKFAFACSHRDPKFP